MRIYVGNISFRSTDETLYEAFSQYGQVEEAAVITDRQTGRSRGFAFVTMPDEDAQKAIEALDGTDVDGRTWRVSEAREPTARRPGGGRRDGDRD